MQQEKNLENRETQVAEESTAPEPSGSVQGSSEASFANGVKAAVGEQRADSSTGEEQTGNEGQADLGGDTAGVVPDESAATIEKLRDELAEAQAKADEYLDRLQRTAAEFQNSRRRQEKLLAEEIEQANANLIRRLLPVLDDLDLAFQNIAVGTPGSNMEAGGDATNGASSAWLDGFRQIQKKLMDILVEQGLTQIELDGEFDPQRHEALSSEPSDTVESGHIIATMRPGYEFKGRVLRPALVRVAL